MSVKNGNTNNEFNLEIKVESGFFHKPINYIILRGEQGDLPRVEPPFENVFKFYVKGVLVTAESF